MIMNNPVIISSRGASDMYGKYIYTKSTIYTRMQRRQVMFKDQNGRDVLSRGIAYTKASIQIGDKITWLDTTYTVEGIDDTMDIVGVFQFHKCYLL